nr:MAG TPA: hypothetical protein [Caudoviricetes sp.]
MFILFNWSRYNSLRYYRYIINRSITSNYFILSYIIII